MLGLLYKHIDGGLTRVPRLRARDLMPSAFRVVDERDEHDTGEQAQDHPSKKHPPKVLNGHWTTVHYGVSGAIFDVVDRQRDRDYGDPSEAKAESDEDRFIPPSSEDRSMLLD